MQVQRIDNMFNFVFEKTAGEVRAAAEKKLAAISAKIEERKARVAKMRAEYKITDAVWNDIQTQMRAAAHNALMAQYNSTVQSDSGNTEEVVVGAGVVNFLMTEIDYIAGEKAQVERLDILARNIVDVIRRTASGTSYVELPRLTYEELKFLGF